MENTLSALQAELEELEKRIKALTNAQNTTSALLAIKEYFEAVQNYLALLKEDFSSHTLSCEEYSTQIQDLQSQIDTINQTITDSDLDNADFEALQSQITLLRANLTTLEEKFDALTANSTATISSLETDISTLQTDIGYISDDIDQQTTEISAINSTIGDQQTQINNLNSTQNTLTTAQSSLSSKVSGLDNRLTTAENELSAITGGIDLTELDERVGELEASTNESYIFRDYSFGFTPSNKTFYTREYYFSIDVGKSVKEVFNLYYASTSEGIMTIEVIKNHSVEKIVEVDLSVNSTNYEFCYKFIASSLSQATRLKISASTELTINELQMEIFGTGIGFYRYDNDVKVSCFNGEIYVTKYSDGLIKYGKFATADEIDFDNLPNTATLYDDDCDGYTFCQFMPTSYPSDTLQSPAETLIYEGIDGYFRTKVIVQSSDCEVYERAIISNGSGNLVSGPYNGIRAFIILNGVPCCFNVNASNTIDYFTIPTDSKWKYVVGTQANFYGVGLSHIIASKTCCIALNKDGYFYNFPNMNSYSSKKIAKGSNATAYLQEDGTTNCYIVRGNNTFLYKIDSNNNSSLSLTFNDCDCVYETYNGRIIKHTKSTNVWEVEVLS